MSDTPNADQLPPPDNGGGSPGGPVTTVVTRHVKPEHCDDYEDWLSRLLHDAETLPGYLGADIHPPTADSTQATYTSVFRFDHLDNLRRFERSDLRHRYLAEVTDYVEADAAWQTHTGLELWFSPPPGTVVPQPVRWRMAVVLGTVVYALVLVFGAIASATIGALPPPLRLAIVIAIEITLMTYLILPWLTRKLANWIYPRSTST